VTRWKPPVDHVDNLIPLFNRNTPDVWDQAFAYHLPYVKAGPYQYQLTVEEEVDFQEWLNQYGIDFPYAQDDKTDFDMRGYWALYARPNGVGMSNNRHFRLEYQTPYSAVMEKNSRFAKEGIEIAWHGNQIYNRTTRVFIFWAGSPTQIGDASAVDQIASDSAHPGAEGNGFMAEGFLSGEGPKGGGVGLSGIDMDTAMKNFVIYLSGKIKLKAYDQVTDARVNLTIEGASTIEVDLNDDDRTILHSGTLSHDLGLRIDGLNFTLVQVKKDQGDSLTLVFENAPINRLRHQGVRYQFHVSLLPGRLAQGLGEHLGIIDAVIEGDPAKAEQLTRDHFAAVIDAVRQFEAINLPPIVLAR